MVKITGPFTTFFLTVRIYEPNKPKLSTIKIKKHDCCCVIVLPFISVSNCRIVEYVQTTLSRSLFYNSAFSVIFQLSKE